MSHWLKTNGMAWEPGEFQVKWKSKCPCTLVEYDPHKNRKILSGAATSNEWHF